MLRRGVLATMAALVGTAWTDPGMKASYGPTPHHAFDLVYYTVLRDGEPTVLTDCKLARR